MVHKRVECNCATCQSWCRNMPGWFKPHEVRVAAAHLGLSVSSFFKQYLVIDFWLNSAKGTTYALRPRETHEKAGSVAAPIPPRGVCVFYVDGKCQIHAVKPYECAVTKHDVELPGGWKGATVARAWRSKRAQTFIENLNGKPPKAKTSWSFMEMVRTRSW